MLIRIKNISCVANIICSQGSNLLSGQTAAHHSQLLQIHRNLCKKENKNIHMRCFQSDTHHKLIKLTEVAEQASQLLLREDELVQQHGLLELGVV